MGVDGRPKHVVLEGGHTLPGVERTEEGRGMGVGELTVLELGWVVILAGFLQRKTNNRIVILDLTF